MKVRPYKIDSFHARKAQRIEERGAEPMADLTAGQEKWLRRANALGQIVWNGPRGYGRSVYERVMQALQAKGLVVPNAFGEYELTDTGREILR